MNKAQLIKELNTYTKEEIIEAIADTDSILAQRITSKLIQNNKLASDAATEAYKKANNEFETYRKETNEKYGTLIVKDLPADVRRKLLDLRLAVLETSERLDELKERQRIREKELLKGGLDND